MRQIVSTQSVWPYVLPFPLDSEKRGLVWSIFQSRVGLKILGEVSVDQRTYQHDLIEKLPYSNKSIIKYLKKMMKAEILEEGMEISPERGRKVWIKWYKPTSLGKWLVLFLKPPSEVSPDLTRAVVEELFHLYASSIVEACQKYCLDIDSFHRDLDRQYLFEVVRKRPQNETADVAVFGSAALDVYGSLTRLPVSDEIVYVEETGRCPGGMGANVAVALSKLNVPVAFFGRIGSDAAGRMLLENLNQYKVGVSHVHPADGPSLQTLILRDKQGHRWLFTVGSPQSAISLRSLNEIDWKAIDNSRLVYIGEVFIEVASAIADYAKARNKTVIYRPGAPYMKYGVEKLRPILEHTTIFILNQSGWRELSKASGKKIDRPSDLLKYGVENIILTKGADGCEIFSVYEDKQIPVPQGLKARFRPLDLTGAGDGFSAGLIKGLLLSWTLERAIVYGEAVAAITCSRFGTSDAFPTEKEVQVTV